MHEPEMKCERCGKEIVKTDVRKPFLTIVEYAREPHVDVNYIGPTGYSTKMAHRHVHCDAMGAYEKELTKAVKQVYDDAQGGKHADAAAGAPASLKNDGVLADFLNGMSPDTRDKISKHVDALVDDLSGARAHAAHLSRFFGRRTAADEDGECGD